MQATRSGLVLTTFALPLSPPLAAIGGPVPDEPTAPLKKGLRFHKPLQLRITFRFLQSKALSRFLYRQLPVATKISSNCDLRNTPGETTKNLLPLSVTTTAGILISSGANAACQRSCTEVAEECVSMEVREPRALRTRATVWRAEAFTCRAAVLLSISAKSNHQQVGCRLHHCLACSSPCLIERE
jgi:hypothetical protein